MLQLHDKWFWRNEKLFNKRMLCVGMQASLPRSVRYPKDDRNVLVSKLIHAHTAVRYNWETVLMCAVKLSICEWRACLHAVIANGPVNDGFEMSCCMIGCLCGGVALGSYVLYKLGIPCTVTQFLTAVCLFACKQFVSPTLDQETAAHQWVNHAVGKIRYKQASQVCPCKGNPEWLYYYLASCVYCVSRYAWIEL